MTATPDNRTYGFFRKNVVSEYSHEKAVADGVNVGNEIYFIETERSRRGATIKVNQQVERRERLSRRKRWETQDADEAYTATQLDRDIVNPDQIRTVIRTFRDKLPEIFPRRQEVPKTLIFAKTDSHADDIIQTVREEFAQGNNFCKKITYQSKEDPKSVLAQFRNDYNPRIAVTVDMIATGTDVKPLECLLFMRDVKSRNYFEQMKGRGTRTLDHDDLKKVTPSAATAKTHYVIVDAIGVTKSLKTTSEPLITKPSVPLRDLAMGVMMGIVRPRQLPGSARTLDAPIQRPSLIVDSAKRGKIRRSPQTPLLSAPSGAISFQYPWNCAGDIAAKQGLTMEEVMSIFTTVVTLAAATTSAYAATRGRLFHQNAAPNVEAADVQEVFCNGPGETGRTLYVYQYTNRPGTRAVIAPNWGAPIFDRPDGAWSFDLSTRQAIDEGCTVAAQASHGLTSRQTR